MSTFRYRIEGRVCEAETGRPLVGLRVCAYDLDLLKDDSLGEAVSDADGSFQIRFTERAFQELPGERPDLYLRIFDASGRVELASTQSEVRRSARVEERFEVRIPSTALRG